MGNQSASHCRRARIGMLPDCGGSWLDVRLRIGREMKLYLPPLRVAARVKQIVEFVVTELAEIDCWGRRETAI
jgi:hypothetical protein